MRAAIHQTWRWRFISSGLTRSREPRSRRADATSLREGGFGDGEALLRAVLVQEDQADRNARRRTITTWGAEDGRTTFGSARETGRVAGMLRTCGRTSSSGRPIRPATMAT